MMDDAEPQAAQPKLEIVDEEDDGVERFTASSPIPKVYRTKNDNLTHLLFAKEEVGSEKKDSAIIEKLAEQFREENQGTIEACPILAEIGVDRIKQMVLGPRHVAFLLDDDNVIRMGYQSSKVKDIPVMQECSEIPSTMSQSAQQAAAAALQQSARTSGIAKYRRVMLGGRSYCGLRTGTGSQARGVIIGRPSAAQNIPVPEELINNVQQVLQGKSREIIIRELQRTGLNVNEAVNNLLSRDDGDDPMDMSGADPILPEELLQLLEHSSAAIGGHPLDDPFEALNFSRLTKRKELKNEKKKEQSEIYRSIFMLSPDVEWWRGEEGCGKPREVLMMDDTEPIVDEERMERQKGKCSPIVSITCTTWALYALHKNGKIYTWNWDDDIGSEHEFRPPNFEEKSAENVPVVMITSSNLRICAILQNGAMISWLETLAVGRRVQKATESYGQIPVEQVGLLKDFTTSDYIAAVRCENVVYWCGIYPPSDRSKSTEKAAEKSEKDRKKHVSFGETSISSTTSNSASSGMNSASNSASGSSEIHVGSQVQLKKSPIFPAGSVGVFIDTEKPMIGVLLEDSWNFGENCRFRILSVEEYDGESVKMEILEEEEEQYVQQPNQSRKRKAAEALSDPFHDDPVQKIEIWPIDEVLWIHEHRKRDVMTVEVVDNQMVAVKFNETSRNCMKYASLISDNPEGNSRSSNQQTNQGMRILRKDELQVLKNPAKNGEKLAKLVQKEVLSFMIDMSKPIISMCADLTGFRILVRSRHDQILLCKVPVTGKVVMRSRLPLNALAVEKRILRGAEGKCPELVNFGDSRTLFIRDSAGQLIPLLRDALNGYREPQILHSQPINLISTYSRPKRRNGSICEKGATAWEGSVLCIPGTNRPNHRHFLKDFASLMQLVLYCDLHGVQAFLNKINDLRQSSILSQDEFRQIMSEQLFAITSDGCSNIIHAAIRLCVAARNSQNQDKITPETLKSTPPKFAAKNVENEKRWKGVLRGRRRSQEVEDGQEIEENIEVLQSGTVVEDFSMGNPIKTPEIRQKNAMGILDLLLKHLTMFFDIEAENGVEFLDEKDRCSALKALLSARDINGRTPFMLAVNLRAYGAAGSVWQCLLQLGFADMVGCG
ncbi:unnamed protein product [Caenorhabditis angaria]|uniref:E3 ubiquitin-protein ligase UBR5 ubiquitin-associated domain-containing protein n=1 Tax=Caenorhabditis angaria TaxID=860376 RepID=A0A9P1IRQ1_9PELO|nr:unnamed protein product [Caenorhabditis angaria]